MLSSEILKNDMYMNEFVEDYSNKNHPKFNYFKTKLVLGNISEYTSISEEKNITLNKNLLNKIDNIFWSESRKKVRYYSNTDIFSLPKAYKESLYNGESIDTKITIYNSNMSHKTYDFLKNCKTIEISEPNTDYLPDELTYTMFDNETYFLEGLNYFLFKNMPLNLLSNIKTFIDDSVIDVNSKKRKYDVLTEKEFNSYCQDIAKNGIKEVLPLKLNDDNSLTPINCSTRIIIAKLLNIPYIPVCIVHSYYHISEENIFKKINVNKEELGKFLSPQILLG